MGNFAAHALARVSHRTAYPVDRILGDEALETGDLGAGLLLGKTISDEDEAQDPVALDEKLSAGHPGR